MPYAQLIMLKKTISHLLSKAKPSARRELQILLAHVLGHNQTFVLAHPEYQVDWLRQYKYSWCVIKRAYGIPLAYILGHKEFFGLDFLVNKHTLIPRPETEIMVEAALEKIHSGSTLLIDVGTGTGCIPISIVKNTSQPITAYGLDISTQALAVAQANANALQTSVQFLTSNLLANFPAEQFSAFSNIIITANLPYLTKKEFYSEPSIQHEPKSALIAKQNGLALYFELIVQLKKLLGEKKNRDIALFCEINPNQVNELKQAIAASIPQAHFLVRTDLAGLNRILCTFWID